MEKKTEPAGLGMSLDDMIKASSNQKKKNASEPAGLGMSLDDIILKRSGNSKLKQI